MFKKDDIIGKKPRLPSRPYPPYKCLRCRGKGTIYDPNDPPCPIEGYKMVSRIACPNCEGSGEGTKAQHLEKWEKDKEETRKKIEKWAEYKSYIEKLNKLLKQELTKEEREFLKRYLVQTPRWPVI